VARLPLATEFLGLEGREWARLGLGVLALGAFTAVVLAVVLFLTRDRHRRF
jgi:hypothetical protein